MLERCKETKLSKEKRTALVIRSNNIDCCLCPIRLAWVPPSGSLLKNLIPVRALKNRMKTYLSQIGSIKRKKE